MSDSSAPLVGAWLLDPEVTYLNHGSFGSCPGPVLDVQGDFRRRFEREPVRFVEHALEGLLDETRVSVGAFMGADPQDLVFVANATTGVNTVLQSLPLGKADELIVTDHAYNACRNAIEHYAERAGARVVVVRVPFPLKDPEEIVAAVLASVTPRTRLALLDHVSSPTAIIFPIERLVRELEARGVETLVDGAHAPGMVRLDLKAIGATYYTANFHKWCCAPKGAGVLYVRRDRQKKIRPLVISHGANSPRQDRSRFLLEFDWTGTRDMSAILSIPYALRYLDGLVPGGFSALLPMNHALAIEARRIIADRLDLELPCPDDMVGSMATLVLPDAREVPAETLHRVLQERWRIEVPVFAWPAQPSRLVRVSAQIYNHRRQYEELAEALANELARERAAGS
ncbi:MAG: aminotransferase class V-fold PLP-dependent enzyme [Polyangiaceae bacterium]